MKRRDFLFGLGLGWFPNWFPFFHRRFATLAGIRFEVLRNGRSSRRYLFIHGDEPTARDVLRIHLEAHPGIAYLVTGSEREVAIDGGKLDPNRMFSTVGAEKNLKKLNPAWPADKIARALEFLDREREKLLRRLTPPRGGLLIALHNNREYSVQDEAADSDEVSLKQPERPREFFLCTDPRDYAAMAKSDYNVVLQNRTPAVDDGSLSRLAAHRGFRYVNLECAVGRFEDQMERLGWAERNLAERL